MDTDSAAYALPSPLAVYSPSSSSSYPSSTLTSPNPVTHSPVSPAGSGWGAAAADGAAAGPTLNGGAANSASSTRSSPLKVLGRRGWYLVASSPWPLQALRFGFPSRSARWAVALATLAAVVFAVAWNVDWINRKWNPSNPPTTVTTVLHSSLPLLAGLLSLTPSALWLNQSLTHTLELNAAEMATALQPATSDQWLPPNPVPSHGYRWHEVLLSTGGCMQQLGANYECVAASSASSSTAVDGSDPPTLPRENCAPRSFSRIVSVDEEWPLWLDSPLHSLCIRTFSLLDVRALVEVVDLASWSGAGAGAGGSSNASSQVLVNQPLQYGLPTTSLAWGDLEDVQRWHAEQQADDAAAVDGATISSSAASSFPTGDWAGQQRPQPLRANHRHTFSTGLTKHVDRHGRVVWRTTLQSAGEALPLGNAARDRLWASWWGAQSAEFRLALEQDANLQLDDNKPNATTKYVQEMCFGLQSLLVPVVSEAVDGSLLDWLAAMGGVLSLLLMTFWLCFPTKQKCVIPRAFLGQQVCKAFMEVCWEEEEGEMTEEEGEGEESEISQSDVDPRQPPQTPRTTTHASAAAAAASAQLHSPSAIELREFVDDRANKYQHPSPARPHHGGPSSSSSSSQASNGHPHQQQQHSGSSHASNQQETVLPASAAFAGHASPERARSSSGGALLSLFTSPRANSGSHSNSLARARSPEEAYRGVAGMDQAKINLLEPEDDDEEEARRR